MCTFILNALLLKTTLKQNKAKRAFKICECTLSGFVENANMDNSSTRLYTLSRAVVKTALDVCLVELEHQN